MKAPRTCRGIFFSGLVLSIFLLTAQNALDAGSVDEERGIIDYETNAAAEIISLRYVINEIAEQDSEPRLRIYGDGTVIVHFSPYMKKAGTYRLRLSRQEMADLFQTVLRNRVPDFDLSWVKQRKEEIRQRRWARATNRGEPIFHYEIADADVTEITFRLKRYKPAGAKAGVRTNVEKTIRYRGLAIDAEKFEEIEMITGLANVEAGLMSLTRREDLIRIDKGGEPER